jgi:hypothetical protein
MDIVQPDSDFNSTPSLSEALTAVRDNQGPFGGGSTAPELLRMLEWFVDEPCVMIVVACLGDPAAPDFESKCVGDTFQFIGVVADPKVPNETGVLVYDVDLKPGAERVHLELYRKNPPGAAMSLKPHLKRAYRALVRAGIPALELEAGLQAGPTYWARAGVQFRGDRPLLAHLEVVAADLAGASTPPALGSPKDVLAVYPGLTTTIEDAHGVSERLSAVSSYPSWVANDLVDMRDRLKIPIDVPLPIGEAILFAISPWNGLVDLTSPGTSDAEFRAFLGV